MSNGEPMSTLPAPPGAARLSSSGGGGGGGGAEWDEVAQSNLPVPADAEKKSMTALFPYPVNVREYEAHASRTLPRNAFDYYASGANDMITLKENGAAFDRLRLRPRVLRNVENVDLSTTVLGTVTPCPICVAPTAMQRMAHEEGEVATAKACAKTGTLMTLSSWSTCTLEETMEVAPDGPKWFQLYVYKDRTITAELVRRAEAAGYKALAVTVDTPCLGRREPDVRNRFKLPSHLTMKNFEGMNSGNGVDGGGSDDGENNAHSTGVNDSGTHNSGLASYVAGLIDRSLQWDDIHWLRTITALPIVVKGIMTAEDAILAVKCGVDAIWVSNHGARQLDTVAATIELLPPIAAAVAGRCEIYVDGGVRRGTDVFKALALGARAVFVGRPVLWGLAEGGQDGVERVLGLLRDEFELALSLSGCTCLADIERGMVAHASQYSRL